MSVFIVHTIVQRDSVPVSFSPGDELPDWAASKVGDHCLDATGPTKSEVKASKPVVDTPATAAPDFTGKAPARRGRPRKNA